MERENSTELNTRLSVGEERVGTWESEDKLKMTWMSLNMSGASTETDAWPCETHVDITL